jgi:small subunit ribosomal protein S6e
MKIVVSNPENGKSYQKDVEANQAKTLYGKRIMETVKGDTLGLTGYELVITGGSDKQGFPMRGGFHGTARKKLLLGTGPGFKASEKGERMRKSVRGNTISDEIEQVNMKVAKKGADDLEKLMPKGEKKEEKPKAAPAKKKK